MRCPAQLGGRLATVCLPRLRPAVVRLALLGQALLFCCGLRHALRQSLSVVAGCLGNGRLRQQWPFISVGTGCLSNGWLCRQLACISLGVGCLSNGGLPSFTERLGPPARLCLKLQFCSFHWATPNALCLQFPGLTPCPNLVQSQVQPSQVSGCQFNRAPGQARPVWSTG